MHMPAVDGLVLPLPPAAPRVPHNRFTRWLGRTILRLGGWRMEGQWPDVARAVVIAAPHSSNWDGLWGFAAKLAMGLRVTLMGKRELFWWPLGPVLRAMGTIAVDRDAPGGIVEQAVALIRDSGRCWYVIAPEGTRRQVERWKPGFWRIASGAQVPIIPVYFDYPRKVIGVGAPFTAHGDPQAGIHAVQRWYRPWRGRNHDVVQPPADAA